MTLYPYLFSATYSDKLDTRQAWYSLSHKTNHVPLACPEYLATITPPILARVRPESPIPDHKSSKKIEEGMAVKTYTWITLWFTLSAPIILWDVTYCFFRPRSMAGGDLHWIWKPYSIYQEIDYVYGVKALEEGSGFTNAQSFLNLIETFLNLVYVYQAHMTKSSAAPLVGFAAAVMTYSKTVLYFAQEAFCGGCATGHNPTFKWIMLFLIPNGIWLVLPPLIILRLGKDISGSLKVAQKVDKRA